MQKLFVFLVFFNIAIVNAQTNASIWVLSGMRIITGTGDSVINNGTIVFKNGIIEAVGDSSNITIPVNATIIQLKGKTVMPGMVDMHAHFWSNGRQQFQPYSNLYLASGVTTVFSLGEYFPDSLAIWRKQINEGKKNGPRIFSAGLYIQSGIPPNPLMQSVNTSDSAIWLFNKYKNHLEGVKFYDNVNEAVFLAIMQEAKKNNFITTGHLNSIKAEFAIDHGINGLEHGIWTIPELNPKTPGISPYCQIAKINIDSSLVDTIIQKIVRNKVYITATFTAGETASTHFENISPDWKIYMEDASRNKYRSYKSRNQACLDTILLLQKKFIKKVYDKGGLIVTGTDPVFPEIMAGFSVARELKRYVEAGIPHLQAIKMATLNGAIALRKEHLFGSLAKGKLADILVIAGNPDKDINDLNNLIMVFKEGKQYDPIALKKATIGTLRFR